MEPTVINQKLFFVAPADGVRREGWPEEPNALTTFDAGVKTDPSVRATAQELFEGWGREARTMSAGFDTTWFRGTMFSSLPRGQVLLQDLQVALSNLGGDAMSR